MATAALLARGLGAHRQGYNWRCACPLGCGYSLSLSDGDDGRLLAYCHGGCAYGDVLAALVEHGLFDGVADLDGDDDHHHAHRHDDGHRIDTARGIYDHLGPAAGAPVERYLRSRAITIAVPSVLQFGMCPHRCGGTHPAMAAPVVNVDGDLTGVHMTYLRSDGSGKADLPKDLQRECRGVVRGGTIRLAAFNPGQELLIAEGVETTLAAMELFDLPGWSAVSAGGLKVLELPPAVQHIVIAADHDLSGAGQRNAVIAYQRWTDQGRSVRIKVPPDPGDFNDVLVWRGG